MIKTMHCYRKPLLILPVFFTGLIFTSAVAQVQYTLNPTGGCAPLDVTFTNTSVPPSNYFVWQFGDGDTSHQVSPVHTYQQPGYFVPNLQGYDTTGGGMIFQGSYNLNITVNGSSDTFFTSTGPTACPGEKIKFWTNDMFSSLRWNFGDGSPEVYYNWADKTYFNPGVYTVRLIINTGSCGTDTVFQDINITNTAIPYPQITVNQNPVCPGDNIYFDLANNFSAASYLWNFGDASTSTLKNPVHSYAVADTYEVIVEVVNICGNSNTDTFVVRVENNVSANSGYWGPGNPSCPYTVLGFNANGSGNYLWDFGDSTFSALKNPNHFYTDTGTYNVLLNVTNGCSNSDTSFLNLNIQYNPSNKPMTEFNFEGAWGKDTMFICTGEDVEFRNNTYSNGRLTYLWYFGDGDSSTAENPAHLFLTNGTFRVDLIVENGCGGIDTASKWVVVDPAASPVTALAFIPPVSSACPGDVITFIDDMAKGEGGFIYSYSIWFGDGDSVVNITSPYSPESPVVTMHSYLDTGLFNILFIATNTCDISDTLYDTIYITGNDTSPVLFVDHSGGSGEGPYNDTTFCPGDTIDFFAMGGQYHIWQFPGGITDTNQMAKFIFDSVGTYLVNCVFTTGCGIIDTVSDIVYVSNTHLPMPYFDEDKNYVCGLGQVSFLQMRNDGSPETYLWDFGDGNSSTLEDPVHTYLAGGVYNVSLTVTNGCGSASSSDAGILVEMPEVDFTGLASAYCADASAVILTGNPSGGVFSGPGISGNTFDPATAGAGNHSITYDYTNNHGCGNNIIKNTTVFPLPVAEAGSDMLMCAADSVQLNATGGGSYLWSPTTGLSAAGIPNPKASPLGTLKYFVTVTNPFTGCDAVDSVTVIVASSLTADAGMDAGVCTGDSVMLNGSGGGNYLWYPSTGLSDPNIPNPKASPTDTIIYHLVVSSASCSDTDSVTVTVFPLPVASITSSDTLLRCPGDTIILTSGFGASYLWTTGDTSLAISIGNAGFYNVSVTDFNGCKNSPSGINMPAVTPMSISLIITNTTCEGACNGSMDAIVTDGTPPYSFNPSLPAAGLCAGPASVTVTDAYGCVQVSTGNVMNPVPLADTISVINVSCNGLCDGEAAISASGGFGSYVFTWSTVPAQSSATATGLCSGEYFVTFTDAKSCSAIDSVIVSQPGSLTISLSVFNATCFGLCDGSLTTTVSGGTPPYSYNWSTGATGNPSGLSGLCSGPYFVTVTDANGCSAATNGTVNQPPLLTVTVSGNNVTCNGLCNGTASAITSGGTSPFNFLWSSGSTGSTATGLCAGNDTVIVTDLNGCTSSATVTITEPPVLSISISSTNVTCYGLCNGTASASVSGGTPPYSYSWNGPPPQTSSTATGLCTGTFTVTVIDNKGCTVIDSVSVTEPVLLSVTVDSIVNVSCSGGADASATAVPSGGTPPYSYSWNTGESTVALQGVSTGTYTMTVTDQNGCTASASAVVTEPSALQLNLYSTNASCGTGDGSASTGINGGAPPYDFLWNDLSAQTTDTALNLTADAYSVTVTDANNCSISGSINVANNGAATVVVDSVQQVSCNGGNNGAIFITASGNAPFTFNWSNSVSTEDNTGLTAGNYELTVTDNNGCISFGSSSISEPMVLSSIVTATDVVCYGDSTGTAAAFVTGGTPPYSYQWSNLTGFPNLLGLSAGTYSVTVTDSLGCNNIDTVLVTQPPQLTTTVSATDVSCNGGNDGTAIVTAAGGYPPYQYQWNSGSTQSAESGLQAGIYTVTASDSKGCITTDSILISEPGAIVTAVTSTGTSCIGVCDGTADANISGGTAPFSYLWSNGSIAATILGLCAGEYYLTVQDANGCSTSDSTTVTEPTLLSGSVSVTDVFCNGGNSGSATVIISGGSGDDKFLWSTGDTSETIFGLVAGAYSVTVTDTTCSDTVSLNATISEPVALTATTAVTDISCNGAGDGTATVTTTGGTPPYNYLWSNGETQFAIYNLPSAFYNVTVTDSVGCTASDSATVSEPLTLSITLSTTDITCNGLCNGVILVNATGGTPPYSGDGTTTGYCVGVYAMTVADLNGCTVADTAVISEPAQLSLTFSIADATCNGVCTGIASALPTGGTAPVTYLWSTGETTWFIDSLCPGNYSVTITDANGCNASESGAVTDPPLLVIDSLTMTKANCPSPCNDGTATVYASGGTGPLTYQWDNGQMTQTATGLLPDTFYVIVSDANGCAASGNVIIDALVTETEFPISNFQFQIFPNPAKDVIEITFTSPLGNNVERKIKIYDIDGKILMEYASSNGRTSVAGLAEGIYAIRYQIDGNYYGMKKFVIER